VIAACGKRERKAAALAKPTIPPPTTTADLMAPLLAD
jgi:hypothetical protein